jgi:hypothetical protein
MTIIEGVHYVRKWRQAEPPTPVVVRTADGVCLTVRRMGEVMTVYGLIKGT